LGELSSRFGKDAITACVYLQYGLPLIYRQDHCAKAGGRHPRICMCRPGCAPGAAEESFEMTLETVSHDCPGVVPESPRETNESSGHHGEKAYPSAGCNGYMTRAETPAQRMGWGHSEVVPCYTCRSLSMIKGATSDAGWTARVASCSIAMEKMKARAYTSAWHVSL
jgi:hypothetical protein